jgi:hypothetical protein
MLFKDNPVFEAADIHNVANAEPSVLDDTGDFITKGIPLAVGSGLASMANTAISLGNALGGDFEKIDYGQEVKEYDDDLSKYYNDHQQGIDLGGFVATSFIPGTVGLKALKVIQAGNLGKTAASVTGFFRNSEEAFLKKALSSVQVETNQIFRVMDSNKLGAIAAGFGEQTLQAGAFETAVLLSMNQSPTINKEDQGYFNSLLFNSPDILKGALLGGLVGGAIKGFSISGEIKSGIKARDKEDFMSLNMKRVGVTDLDSGTNAAMDFYELRGREKLFNAQKEAGELNDRQIANFEKTQKQNKTTLLERIREELTEEKDAELSKALWNHLQTSADIGGDLPEEVGLRLLGAATRVSRISTEDSTVAGTKVYMGESQLSERHAKNILKKEGNIAPGEYDVAPEGVLLEELKTEGYAVYKDTAGNYRVIPGAKYERELKKSVDKREHDFIVKMGGDQAGRISESAYPVAGDLGSRSF